MKQKEKLIRKVKKQVKRNNLDCISRYNNSTIDIGSSSY